MTVSLVRDPRGAAAASYDLLVVGGGFYGAMLTLEAARRGLSVLLVERDDFGGATSWNSLRIVHGGLRYLQSLDLSRYRGSVAERRWFLRHFPDLVEPLPCLMPLYDPARGGRLRRPAALRLALALNEALSRSRNEGLRPDREVPAGRIVDAAETVRLFPAVERPGLLGGALWYDAVMPDSHRVLVEALRWAHRCGARTLNYAEAVGLRMDAGRVTGLHAVDRETGESLELRGRAVVNCAGPWSRELAGRLDRDLPQLFRPLLAFNVLLDREPPAPMAVAVTEGKTGRGKKPQTWFLLPWKGRVLAGTAYVATTGGSGPGAPPDETAVANFLAALNAAVPGWNVRASEVLRVCHGWIPAEAAGSDEPAGRPILHDHGSNGGPQGLFSASGVKLTTARAVAETTLARLYERLPAPGWIGRPDADPPLALEDFLNLAARDREAARNHMRGLVERQSVIHLEDLLLRRTDWGMHPEGTVAARLCTSLGWSAGRARPGLRAAGRGIR